MHAFASIFLKIPSAASVLGFLIKFLFRIFWKIRDLKVFTLNSRTISVSPKRIKIQWMVFHHVFEIKCSNFRIEIFGTKARKFPKFPFHRNRVRKLQFATQECLRRKIIFWIAMIFLGEIIEKWFLAHWTAERFWIKYFCKEYNSYIRTEILSN